MNNLIKIGLGLALAIVFPFLVGFGYEAFFPTPKQPYELCRQADPNINIDETPEPQKLIARDPMLNAEYKKCYDNAQEKIDIYNRNLFLTTTAFGFLAIAIGSLLFSEKIGPVGPGLVFGGLFTIVYGTMRSFRTLDKKWLFFELLVVFIGIILVTARYLKVAQQSKNNELPKTSQ